MLTFYLVSQQTFTVGKVSSSFNPFHLWVISQAIRASRASSRVAKLAL